MLNQARNIRVKITIDIHNNALLLSHRWPPHKQSL
jgi:hypothetical protein